MYIFDITDQINIDISNKYYKKIINVFDKMVMNIWIYQHYQ